MGRPGISCAMSGRRRSKIIDTACRRVVQQRLRGKNQSWLLAPRSRMHTRRQARNHVKNLERLGYKVTIQAINPETGEFLAAAG